MSPLKRKDKHADNPLRPYYEARVCAGQCTYVRRFEAFQNWKTDIGNCGEGDMRIMPAKQAREERVLARALRECPIGVDMVRDC